MTNRDEKEAGKSIGLAWAASLVATALITLLASFWLQSASIINGGSAGSQKLALLADMRMNLARSAEKEKSAVLSTSDEESAGFAEQSKAAAREVNRDLKTLETIIAKSGSAKEKELVAKFGKSWAEVQQIDASLLESAPQHTNDKALDLSNSIGADLMHKIDDNLAKLTAKLTPASRKAQMDKIAGDARIAIRNIALLQSRHIDATADADKKKLESSMLAEQAKASAALKTLSKMTGKKASLTSAKLQRTSASSCASTARSCVSRH
ncbi:MCP four helix bundle domain-containing protein [Chlorobaculum sp. MV4-Y]|uniref:MCP four helix bundle domain-containing protein n=1 Tax=Chlorobaculum sp. MV4-Y TaxID=2976335 RepID=UPI0021AF5E2F|nr:MCP four helix bundle domain-containing protein [Chlorobaculum sp. MV4-Y]UWX58237.1 MCP four helix bundle domain-containing protein [Chlorobaculum sp. MV4-Y]